MTTDFTKKWDEAGSCGRDSHLIRIEPDHKLNLHLGFTADGRRVMVVSYTQFASSPGNIPEFENIKLEVESLGGTIRLSVILCDSSLKDLFSSVCSDLVYSSIGSPTEEAAATRLINRLVRWSDLLREGASGGMSFSARLGLLGELTLLENMLSKRLVSSESLITAWRGPDGDARDIALDTTSIEVKARMDSTKDTLKISSLDQLDTEERKLALACFRFSAGDSGASLGSIANDISNLLSGLPATLRNFRRKLYLTGFDPEADYVGERFSVTGVLYYQVLDSFPRLVRENVNPAIASATYEIMGSALNQYQLSESEFEGIVSGRN